MIRSTTGLLRLALATLFALPLLAVAITPDASAQGPAAPLEVSAPEVGADQTSVTVIIELDPAGAPLGAISGEVVWDRTKLALGECVVGPLTVCNDLGTSLAFAAFAAQGFSYEERFVQLELNVLDRSAPTDIAVQIDTLADVRGVRLDSGQDPVGTVTFVNAADLGGLNGEVLDASGAGMYGVQVCAVNATGETCVDTTGLGAFVIDGLGAGDYLLYVSDPSGALAPEAQNVQVLAGEVTSGLSATLSDPANAVDPDAPAEETPIVPDDAAQLEDAPADNPPADNPPGADRPAAGEGEIAVLVVAEMGGGPVFGIEVCATMPVIGTGSCGFSDANGLVQLSGLGVGNYELTGADQAGRFDPATPVFVSINPGSGVTADLSMPAVGFGEAPEELAFVDADASSETTGLIASGIALVSLTAFAAARRRNSDD